MKITLKKLLIPILSLSLSSSAWAAEKLIFAADLIRHGDRMPIKEIPADPYPWKQSLGELSPLGMHQEYELGVSFRKKYVDQYHLLPKDYDEKTIWVRSTDINRTLMSAQSVLYGLYPLGTGPHLENDQFSLPNKFQPIPIHTVALDQDSILLVKPSRNIFSKVSNYFFLHHEWKEKISPLQEKLKKWEKVTGLQLNDVHSLGYLADNLYIRRMHHIALPKGLSEQDANEIIDLAKQAMISSCKRAQISGPMGHAFLKALANFIQDLLTGKSTFRYVLFSAHEVSIMAVMNTLGVPVNNIPHYASDLNFSVWEENGAYQVVIKLNGQLVPVCGAPSCSLRQFYSIVE